MKKALVFLFLMLNLSGFTVGQKASDYLKAALTATKQKNYQESIIYCDLALNESSTFTLAYFYRGYNKFMIKDYTSAIIDFSVCIDLNSDYLDAFLYRGLCYQKIGKNLAATRDYNLARQIDAMETLAFITGNIFRAGFKSN